MPNKRPRTEKIIKVDCNQCKLRVDTSDEAVQCDKCQKTLHALCAKIDKRQFNDLMLNSKLEYVCHFCENADQNPIFTDLNEIKQKLCQLDDIKKSIQFMSSQYDTILNGVSANKKKIEVVQKDNRAIREEMLDMRSSIKFLNDERVRHDCVVQGIEFCEDKTSAMEAVLFISQKIGAEIVSQNIARAYFVGNKNASNKKTVIVKFADMNSKIKFMSVKSKLKQVEELKFIYIKDYLTKETMSLLNYAKSLKAVGFNFIFAKGNKIFVKEHEQASPKLVRSLDDVDKLLLMNTNKTTVRQRPSISAAGVDVVAADIAEYEVSSDAE